MIVFGPVPSRRLGRSLGINNIPYKKCSYTCSYCQLGPTTRLSYKRDSFFKPEQIYAAVLRKLEQAHKHGEKVDFLTFVADGEPTLDLNLGKTITLLKKTGLKIAVISNASLIGGNDVKEDLSHVDWVSLKVDTVDERVWREINIPSPKLSFSDILNGIKEFSQFYIGAFVTETMLIKDLNDQEDPFNHLVQFLTQLHPNKAYLSIPIRPPAHDSVKAPESERVNYLYQKLNKRLKDVELLVNSEGEDFAYTGDVAQDILSITSVHPMTEAAVLELLSKSQADRKTIKNLIDQQLLKEIQFEGKKYYLRNWNSAH